MIRRLVVCALERACTALDAVPRYDRDLGWCRHGDWGCWPFRLSSLAVRLDDRWKTGVWS